MPFLFWVLGKPRASLYDKPHVGRADAMPIRLSGGQSDEPILRELQHVKGAAEARQRLELVPRGVQP